MTDLISRVRDAALLRGDFTLRTGTKSTTYLDVRKAYGDPGMLNDLADGLYEAMNGADATCVVGYGFGGNPLATTMSSRHGLKLTLIRDKQKSHGTQSQIEGYVPQENDRVIIPDDVFTSGSSLLRATEIIKPTKAQIAHYGVVVNREQGDPSRLPAPLIWLMTMQEIMAR